jgi:hypothetical protein
MERYRHTQPGHLLRLLLAPGLLVALGMFTVLPGPAQMAQNIGIAVTLFTLLTLVLFHSLTVIVSDTTVSIRFGPGLIRKTLPLDAIQACRTVTNPWYYGWGIHLTRNGWLYNVSGFSAVEVTLRNGKKYRIGTDAPRELEAAIRRQTEQAPA